MSEVFYQGKNFKLKADSRDEADQSVWNEIFKFKEYRAVESIIASAKFPIVDVGAHAGFFVLYARDLNPVVAIYALEPAPDNLEALRQNLRLNNINGVTIAPVALADHSGSRVLALMQDSHNHYLADENEEVEQGIKVSALNLSDLLRQYGLEKISLLKMDIEGGEYEVVDNWSRKDFNKIETIIMEYHNTRLRDYREIEESLRQNGFGVQIFPSKFDKTMGFLLANNKRIK
ncbi:MAG: hypothetical protein COU31_01175 [Candidatus Magasanikbacteria bacterium CG10_big_fil_rev_8_21_14_0_10_40_10]|uniref:Methyltransferase FkbM domain-containing protein n=1 Tax=Candidatus Magasanikbacteria bacterium CG10_big_fil_rev_8_21_14_0_10_40_10 TaxID=1974648 RepID=A0A2M6W4P6_9BACT|nr:MAG: hypothetical protein COU31_01175 [Candidatus Magasanikbacteria bacterium CG10_big_fil_rev_8_21_14_0_10_40_10]